MSMPALRFKEFTDVWRETSLGNVSNGVMYGMNAAAIPYDGINKYIRITDIDDASRAFIPSPLSSPDGEIEDKFKLKNGDLVFARTGASVGKSYLYKEKDGNLLFAGFLVKFSVVRANPYFVYSQTLTPSYKRWLTVMSMRSGQPGVNAEELKEFKFLTPQLSEQTKIANFLTAVDEKISQLTQKSELLTKYKKGVVQQIFNQELRFKDENGGDFPEWEEYLLGDIATLFNGRAYKQTEWEERGTPVIRLQNLTGSGDKYYYSNIKLPENQYCNKGDLLYMWSATFGPVWWQGEKAIYHYHIWKIETNENYLRRNYLFYVLDDITAKMKRTSNGSTMDHITKGGMEKLAVILPTVIEQTKIANFLTAIDDKITATKAQLDAVKQYKQGLLQQMFV